MQTPPPDSPDPDRAAGDAAGFWDRYSGRRGEDHTTGPAGEQGSEASDGFGASDPHEAADPGHEGSSSHPPYGHHGHGGSDHECLDWCPICRGAELLRAAVPPELQAQFQLVQRDALLMAQAMIAAQLERMRAQQSQPGSPPDEDPGVESIPLD